jgi:20S proteasome alpha/beta subunit
MNKNQYSKNCIVYSNDGKILQLEYAQKGAKKSKCSFGFSSGNHTVLFLIDHKFKTTKSESNKIDIVSKNSAMLRAGIIGDGIYISGFIKKKNYEYYYINKKFCPGSKVTIDCSDLLIQDFPLSINICFSNVYLLVLLKNSFFSSFLYT